ncbi:MAG TPA: hypothetical protein VGR41_02535 [Actinomycetota bacterium]|jgi:hypothetical protein|nr:hypothetical protein [Actinomycetota bacterium]
MARFETDIKPLFRQTDREEMLPLFDLWSHEAVRERAELIFERLSAGDMPCDGSWPHDHLERFARWVEEGMPP